MTPRSIAIIAASVVGIVVSPFAVMNLWENLDGNEVMVVQSPISGDMTAHVEPGMKWQGFGKLYKYPRRAQYSFSAHPDQGKALDESIQTQFNDGGYANISGVLNWNAPLKPDQLVRLAKDFPTFEAVEHQLIRPAMQKVIFNVGPTMSSAESAAEKKADIPRYIDDQLFNGPYLMESADATIADPVSGKEKKVKVLSIVLGKDGKPVREAHSQITEYGVGLQPVSLNKLKYSPDVEKQIAERQQAITQVQTAIANAKKAEQDALTIEQQGKAAAMKTKWEQEQANAKEIAISEKEVIVAKNGATAAEQYKRKLILEGEGEAAKKRLIMEADGGLTPKVDAYITVNKAYADAIAKYQGQWVPSVVMGAGKEGSGSSGAQAMIDMLSAKTAKELAIDMTISGKNNTAKK